MKKLLYTLLLIITGLIVFGFFYLNKNYFIITGYAAKKACGCGFIAERDKESIIAQDLAEFPLSLVDITIDKDNRATKASLLGIWESTVKFTDDKGCVLLNDKEVAISSCGKSSPAYDQNYLDSMTLVSPKGTPFEEAFDYAFDDGDDFVKRTRALLVIKDDRLIAEQYSDGFDKDTEILGWSMNKSICNTLIGMLVKEGKLSLDQKQLFTEWNGDERAEITVNDLLRMRPGLYWDEVYSERADATRLLFEEYSCSDFALNKGSEFEPGSYWEYSSGTTNILSKLIRQTIADDEAYCRFPYDSLFSKIGMSSMVLDTDQDGNYILSSYGYATPRDWAKFGLLYLNDGVWNGERLLPEGWVDYTKKITEESDGGCYGAHFWLNTEGVAFPDAPHEIYYASGYQGQHVFIIPSKNAVIVRMGLSQGDDFDMNGVLQRISKHL